MIIVVPPNAFQIENVFFSDAKLNMVMEGNFTKIIYSDENCTLNGLYIDFPVIPLTTNRMFSSESKNFMSFELNVNRELLQKISEIERQLLQYYIDYRGISGQKTQGYGLKYQFMNGHFKYYREHMTPLTAANRRSYVLKISGIWENKREVGITYKILETTT